MTHTPESSFLRVDPVCICCHHSMFTKSTVNDTTFSSGIIKKNKEIKLKEAKQNTLLVFHVSYIVLFLTLNILRLSAMSQMGHKPMLWILALLPSSGSMQ